MTNKKSRKNEDFKKVKLKVGKKLKKTATTDTTITAKRVVLTTQFEQKTHTEEKPLSFRGLTLEELSKQLGHFNTNIRKDAIVGIKQLLTSRPDLISSQLRTLIPSIARLISDARDSAMNGQLKSLLKLLCTAPSDSMAAHITLFLAHVFRGLTHMELPVRNFALSILAILMAAYPQLCRNNADLFPSFVNFLGSSRKPNWNAPNFLETIVSFLDIYDVSKRREVKPCEVEISFDKITMKGDFDLISIFREENASPFDFPVFTTTKSASVSPFELPTAFLDLSKVLAPLLTACILEDNKGGFVSDACKMLETIGRAAQSQPNAFLMPDFKQKAQSSMEQVKKAVGLRKKGSKLRKSADWLFV
ncbi:unnamed protein product [Caenorhabditis auriculariae]|uniref:Pre-rRNA-processing protein Ipi1 N-terminal domain-containing protein n=1 Tax=Caenorhabditis auriculariae TaxID=2777116 RepID=A0A8S1HI84_9PELO|nr:unnamed protein product [Caenorhabditis auriculariae]